MNDCESHPGNEKSFLCSMPTCFKTLCTVCLQQHGGVHMNLPFNPQPLADAVDYCRERMQVHRESIDWELQRITENQYYEQIVKGRLAKLRSLHKHIRALVRQLFVQYEDAYSQQLSRFAKQVQSNLFELRRELQDKIRDVREISTGLEQRQYHAKLVEYILRNEENVKNEMRAFKDKYAACIESVEGPEPVRLDSQFDEKLQDLIVSSVYIENAPAVRYKSERLRDVSPKLQTLSQQKPRAFFGQAETTPQSSYARSAAPENISSIHSRVRRTTKDLMQQRDYPPEPHVSLQGRFATAAEEAAQSQQSSSLPNIVNARGAPQFKPSLRTETRENAQDFYVTRPDFFIGETRAFLHYLQQRSWGIDKATLALNIFDITVLNPKWKEQQQQIKYKTDNIPQDLVGENVKNSEQNFKALSPTLEYPQNDPKNAIDLEKILRNDSNKNLVNTLSQTLRAQGWAFVHLSKKLDNAANKALKSLRKYFVNTSQEEKISFFSAPQYGYQISKYKEAMTILTGHMIYNQQDVEKLVPEKFQVRENFLNLAKILDETCCSLLYNHGIELYGQGWMSNQYRVPLMGYYHVIQRTYGMLDCVRYFPKSGIQSYQNNGANQQQHDVGEHIDPGLFSISLVSDAAGLELKDANGQWIPVPINIPQLGVIWNGLLAIEIGQSTNHPNKGGWHRVTGVRPDIARMTIWYEVCASSQVSVPIQEEGMLALSHQNDLYMNNNLIEMNPKIRPQTLKIVHQDGQIKNIQVQIERDTVGILKLYFQDELGVRMSKALVYQASFETNGKILDDSQKLSYYGLKDGDQLEIKIYR